MIGGMHKQSIGRYDGRSDGHDGRSDGRSDFFKNTSALQLWTAEERSDMQGPRDKEERIDKRKEVMRGIVFAKHLDLETWIKEKRSGRKGSLD